jgi:hypothetical protein
MNGKPWRSHERSFGRPAVNRREKPSRKQGEAGQAKQKTAQSYSTKGLLVLPGHYISQKGDLGNAQTIGAAKLRRKFTTSAALP